MDATTVAVPKAGNFGTLLPTPTKTDGDDVFLGWYTTSSSNGTRIQSDTKYYCVVTNTEEGKDTPAAVTTKTVTVTIRPKHTHDWGDWTITVEPTTETTGTAERECTAPPAHTETVILPVLTDTSVWTPGKRVEPTDETDGSQKYTSEYGEVTVNLPATGHTHEWGAWRITKEPTLTETGTAERVCTLNSNHKDTKELPVLTDTTVWTPGGKIEPTETEKGSQTYESEYGEVTVVLPALDPSGGGKKPLAPGGSVDLPDGGTARRDEDGVVTIDRDGDGKPDITIETPKSGEVTVDTDTGETEVPGGSTIRPDGAGKPAVKLPDGGTIDPGSGGVTPGESGSAVIGGESGIVVTPPVGGEDREILIAGDGQTTVPGGTVIRPDGEDSPLIRLPDGGRVDPDTGSTTAPKVEVNGTTVTPPSGSVSTDKEGNTPVGPGATANKGEGTDNVTVTVVEGNAVVDKDGNVNFPDGGTASIQKGESPKQELIVPPGGNIPTDSSKLTDVPVSVEDQEEKPVSNAHVELRRGVKTLAKGVTDANGWYTFYNIPDGLYNLVATEQGGGKTVTSLVSVSTGTKRQVLRMPSDNVSSRLDVKDEVEDAAAKVSETVVGGLDREAEEHKPQDGSSVSIEMTVEKEEEKADASHDAIREQAGDGVKTLEFLSITVMKTVTSSTGTVADETITETKTTIELIIPFDFSHKNSLGVYRHHGNGVDTLREITGRLHHPQTTDEGTFWADKAHGLIYIYAGRFSTYAIGYTVEEGGSHVHRWSAEWAHDDTHHWHDCTAADCPVTNDADKGGYELHVYDNDRDAVCNTCGYQRSISHSSGSGSTGSAVYTPKVNKTEHGTVTVEPEQPRRGDRVTVTLIPDTGYRADGVTVVDRDGNPVAVTDVGNGVYTFIQPAGQVTVTGALRADECLRDRTCPIAKFSDASPAAWYHDGVHYCLEEGLMAGYDTGLFGPADRLSRAQLVQILYNHAGRPAVDARSVFGDVRADAWYAAAVVWAAERGVVNGYDDGRFAPDDAITREQLAAILWRYGGAPAAHSPSWDFSDAGSISAYAVDALRWAYERKIVLGKENGVLDPRGNATRAEAAAMLMRFLTEE